MPFAWKSKGKARKKVAPEVMKSAVKRVLEDGKSVNESAKYFEIDRKTLGRYVKNVKNNVETDFVPNHVSNQIFSPDEEKVLEKYLINASKLNYGLSPRSTRKFVYEFACANKKKIPEYWTKHELASYDWLRGFMKRHANLSLRTPQATSLSRGTAFNRTTVTEFFNNLRSVFGNHSYGPETIFNIDETGVTTVQKPGKVIAQKGEKQVSRVTSGERGTLVTMCAGVSAIGAVVPPFFVFPRKRVSDRMKMNAPPGSEVVAHDSGWMTGQNFEKYWLHFIKYTHCSISNPVLVILDNHDSHITPNGLHICKDNGITLLTLPPHTSHKLQPLDRSVFGPFKSLYNSAADDFMVTHPGVPIAIYDIPGLVTRAFSKAFTPSNIQSGFKCTGICPFNSNIFSDEDFFSSYVTDRPEPTIETNASSQTDNATIISSGDNVLVPDPNDASKNALVIDKENVVPSTSKTAPMILPEELRPYPKAGARKKGYSRKRVVSRILTLDPVIREIEDESNARTAKKRKVIEKKKEREENSCTVSRGRKVATKKPKKGPGKKSR